MMNNGISVNAGRNSAHPPILEYDGSFPGFLCAVAELIGNVRHHSFMGGASGCMPETGPSVVSREKPCELFEERRAVLRDDLRARRLWGRFRRLLGPRRSRIIIECFNSDRLGADKALSSLLVRTISFGIHVFDDLASRDASEVEKAATRTRRELELMLGLTRFSELADDGRGEGLLYACIRPSCNLLDLMGDHFNKRFPGLRWIIHDGMRHSALLHEPYAPCWMVMGFQIEPDYSPAIERKGDDGDYSAHDVGAYPPLSAHEGEIRSIWRLYFHKIAIRERANPRLQNSKIPAKYRTEMTEFGTVLLPGKKLEVESLDSMIDG
jgi:probable DNA metabolism protein